MIQTLPWMTRISSTGSPADLKVKTKTRITKTMVRMLIKRLSFSKEDERSKSLVELPTTRYSL